MGSAWAVSWPAFSASVWIASWRGSSCRFTDRIVFQYLTLVPARTRAGDRAYPNWRCLTVRLSAALVDWASSRSRLLYFLTSAGVAPSLRRFYSSSITRSWKRWCLWIFLSSSTNLSRIAVFWTEKSLCWAGTIDGNWLPKNDLKSNSAHSKIWSECMASYCQMHTEGEQLRITTMM